MLYYFFLFLLLLYIYQLGLSSRFQVALYCILLFVFASLRFNVGYDYPAYYHFIVTDDYGWFEPLSRLLMYVGRQTDPLVFFLLAGGLIVFFYYRAFDRCCVRSKWDPVAIFAFVGLPIAYLDSLGAIRQFIAIAIFVYVASDIQRVRLASLGWMVVACLFHSSAAIFLPFVLLASFFSRPHKVGVYLLLWLAVLVVGPFLIRYISLQTGFYTIYFSMHVTDSGGKIYLLLASMMGYFLINRKIIFEDANHVFIFNCYFIGILIFSAALPFGIHVSRAGWGFLAVHPLLFGVVLARKAYMERMLFVVFCFLLMCVALFLSYKNPQRDFLNQYQVAPLLDKFQRDLKIDKSLRDEIWKYD